jgi:hypothetical protein
MQRGSPTFRARLAYQEQDSALTLAQALEEYYSANVGAVTRPDDLPPESRALFRSHDICHVIFGLGTSLVDEALADTRTLLSSDVGLRRYARYLASDKQAKAIFRDLGYMRSIWAMVRALPRLAKAIIAAWLMPTKWPWQPPAHFEQRSLFELRTEFGIHVI